MTTTTATTTTRSRLPWQCVPCAGRGYTRLVPGDWTTPLSVRCTKCDGAGHYYR